LRNGNDITIVATGETVRIALDAADQLRKDGIEARILNYHTIKPFDSETLLQAASETGKIISIEEHSIYGGLGGAVAEVFSEKKGVSHKIMGMPDEPAITGNAREIL
jgi:transketolase